MKLSQKRAKRTKRIDTYTKRREKYKQTVLDIGKKINDDKREVVRIDKISAKIKILVEAVKAFSGIRGLKGNARNIGLLKLAKGLFYKYGIENGIRSSNLRDYIGSRNNTPGYDYRKWLTKEITNNPATKQVWENFKRYMEGKL